jgi:hypothetical protein
MSFRPPIKLALNVAAVLALLGMGAALANPIEIGTVLLYGPELLTGSFNIDAFDSFISAFIEVTGAPLSGFYYVIPDLSGALTSLNDNLGPLLTDNVTSVALLPAGNPIFAAVPEPVSVALLVSGIAGVAYLRRKHRARG